MQLLLFQNYFFPLPVLILFLLLLSQCFEDICLYNFKKFRYWWTFLVIFLLLSFCSMSVTMYLCYYYFVPVISINLLLFLWYLWTKLFLFFLLMKLVQNLKSKCLSPYRLKTLKDNRHETAIYININLWLGLFHSGFRL